MRQYKYKKVAVISKHNTHTDKQTHNTTYAYWRHGNATSRHISVTQYWLQGLLKCIIGHGTIRLILNSTSSPMSLV